MNLTKNTLLALVALTTATVGFAQSAPAETKPTGLLGESFSEVRFGLSDIKNYSKHQYGAGLAANVPMTSFLDVGLGYDYSWVRHDQHANTATVGATFYRSFNGVKPFVGAAVGYQWISYDGAKDDLAIWGAAAGVEIPVGPVSITPRIVYSDDFRSTRRSTYQTSYEVEANYWVSRTFAVFASAGRSHVNGAGVSDEFDRSWDYTIGARFKF